MSTLAARAAHGASGRPNRTALAVLVAAFAGACGGGGGSGATSGVVDAVGAPAAALSGGMPTRQSIAGKPVVGRIIATSGQVIEDRHVVTDDGPCIVIPDGVSGVTIRNSEIGPCGQAGDAQANGIDISPGASFITIARNVIHDVASGVYARGALHPIVIDRNLVYNIRGPFPRGQAVQFNGVSAGTSASRITCNVSDTSDGNWSNVEDHISLFDSPGLASDRTVIAHNRLRGGSPTSDFGSGIMIGDGQTGGHVWAHHNTVVNVANAGMGIAGGRNVTLEANRVYLDGRAARSRVGIVVQNYESNECVGHLLVGNRVWAVDVIGSSGTPNHAHFSSGCSEVSEVDNTLGDLTLSAASCATTPRPGGRPGDPLLSMTNRPAASRSDLRPSAFGSVRSIAVMTVSLYTLDSASILALSCIFDQHAVGGHPSPCSGQSHPQVAARHRPPASRHVDRQ